MAEKDKASKDAKRPVAAAPAESVTSPNKGSEAYETLRKRGSLILILLHYLNINNVAVSP